MTDAKQESDKQKSKLATREFSVSQQFGFSLHCHLFQTSYRPFFEHNNQLNIKVLG